MSFSSGTFSINSSGQPVVAGTVISTTAFNALTADLATGLSTAVLKDGTQTMTASLPMAAFKITGLGAGSALTDAASITQVQNGFGSFLTSVAGTNTITGTATPTPAYAVGQRFTFVPAVTNTLATTLNISGVGAGAVQLSGAALLGGELQAGVPVTVYVTATTPVFEILCVGSATGSTASTFTFDGSGGTSGSITMTWQKVGNWVTLNIPAVSATSGTTSTTLLSNTALAAGVRPTVAQQQPCNVMRDNGAAGATPGVIAISTGGLVSIKRDFSSTAFTNSASGGTGAATNITYFIG